MTTITVGATLVYGAAVLALAISLIKLVMMFDRVDYVEAVLRNILIFSLIAFISGLWIGVLS